MGGTVWAPFEGRFLLGLACTGNFKVKRDTRLATPVPDEVGGVGRPPSADPGRVLWKTMGAGRRRTGPVTNILHELLSLLVITSNLILSIENYLIKKKEFSKIYHKLFFRPLFAMPNTSVKQLNFVKVRSKSFDAWAS